MTVTAIAPANIAFIKYWGKKDDRLRLPSNASISMNLNACMTTTTVEFSTRFEKDTVSEGFDTERIIKHVDCLRNIAGLKDKVHITTMNSFPKSAGVASSASGFAALTIAVSSALGLKLTERELSGLARLGSGSAARSIPDGFVKWEDSFAYSLHPPDYWDLRDILVIVEKKQKSTSSSVGHALAHTSPYFQKRLDALPERLTRCERALKNKDIVLLGEVIEEDCLDMHHVMQTQTPPLYYWNETTKKIIDAVGVWREQGIPVYFTIDAGPNVHLICEAKQEDEVVKLLEGKYQIIVNKPAPGAHII